MSLEVFSSCRCARVECIFIPGIESAVRREEIKAWRMGGEARQAGTGSHLPLQSRCRN